MPFNLDALARPNIRNLNPYSSARNEFSGEAEIFLDANENSFGSPLETAYNRYPDPLQIEIKETIGDWLNISSRQIFVGNGSDEAIDLLFRVFCQPGIDEVIITPPTYGMYEVSAGINDVRIRKVLLDDDFQLSAKRILEAVNAKTKLIFLCSPNNPTGNSFDSSEILKIAREFDGIVIVDEAYVHFSGKPSLVEDISGYPNLVVLQTFSKAWGLAGLRVGTAFAGEEIIDLLNLVKPPYNVSQIAQETLLKALKLREQVEKVIAEIVRERESLAEDLRRFSFVARIYPSDANFLLVKTANANDIYRFLAERKIIVRNRSQVELCAGCLRITIGTPEENETLLSVLGDYESN